ncbi:head maturation protease, ClpP-related [Micromonospora marina]|uniref:head maturation protease, ClpP-related n=1 Tax=Micromonospora marina TaxID=307120 RepID=UPI0034555507
MRKQYRFRGSIAPSAEVKRPVRAEVVGTVEDGMAKLHLDDVIDSWGGFWGISAKEFNQALAELGDVDQIHLHINSPGGEVWEGVAILNALRRHPATVTAIVDGLAASAASFIAVGADRTVMGRNTQMMIHDAWGIGIGPAADMRDLADRLDKISNNIADMYATKAGGDLAGWRALMVTETWYDAEEAVAAGLADEVEGTAAVDDEIVANAFDLSVFKHQGRAKAPDPAPPAPEPEPAPPTASHDDSRKRRFRFRQRAAARR